MKQSDLYSKRELKGIIAFYKTKSFIVKSFLKTGLAVDRIWPFIFAGLLSLYGYKNLTDDYVVKKTEEVGQDLLDKIEELGENEFLFSTSWQSVDGKSNLSRTEIRYKLNDAIDIDDAEGILSMSEEELMQSFSIEDIKVIEKHNDNTDYMYNTDLIVLPEVLFSEDENLVRTKYHKEDKTLLILLIGLFLGGGILSRAEDILTKSYVKNYLTGKFESLSEYYKDEIHCWMNIYNEKQKNNKGHKIKNISYKISKMSKN